MNKSIDTNLKRMANYHPFLFVLLFSMNLICFGQKNVPVNNNQKLLSVQNQIFNFENQSATVEIAKLQNSPMKVYLASLNQTIQVLISDDLKLFESFENNEDLHIDAIQEFGKESKMYYILQAEIYYHWALMKLYFDEQTSAALSLKKSYDLLQKSKRKYPTLILNDKLDGLYNVALDQVPSRYKWLFEFLGYKGDLTKGFDLLKKHGKKETIYSRECRVLYCFLRQQIEHHDRTKEVIPDSDLTEIDYLIKIYVCYKNKRFEELKETLSKSRALDKFNYYNYLKGDILLKQGNYQDSQTSSTKFLDRAKGISHVKSAWLNLFYASFLLDDTKKASQYLEKVETEGGSVRSKDRYAKNFANNYVKPNKYLLAGRLFFDGGEYEKALANLNKLDYSALTNIEKIEFSYREARIRQDQKQMKAATTSFKKVIEESQKLSGDYNEFFPAYSSLQLGKYFLNSNPGEAKQFFQKVFDYDSYSYQDETELDARNGLRKVNKILNDK